jgi:transposase
MHAPKPREGYIDRGMKFPAYPTEKQIIKSDFIQPSLRAAWNWMVSRIEEPIKALEARAMREGLLPPSVSRPCYAGLNPDEAKTLKHKFITDCRDRQNKIFGLPLSVEWRPFLSGKDSEADRLGMTQGYQVLNNYLEFKGLPTLPSAILQKLEENFQAKPSGQNRKTYRRKHEVMPIQVRTGEKIRIRKQKPEDGWHQRRCNYEVNLPLLGWIAVYLDPDKVNLLMTPGNTARLGCTLKYDHGKWFASVKIMRREVMHPGPGDDSLCGIDPGLDKLAAVSDHQILKNPRNLKYDDARNLALSIASLNPNKEEKKQFQEAVYRHDARQRRRVLTQCRQLAAKLCNQYDFIGIEANSGVALGIGSRYTGATKTLFQCLINRCGHNRVREVEAYFNSQICSQCGHHDKIAWERKIGVKDQTCRCPACGFEEDRDVNSACNVKNRLAESLALN